MTIAIAGLVLFTIGHLAIWCTIFNQIHATRCPRTARKGSELLTLANLVILWLVEFYILLFYPSWLHPNNLMTLVVGRAGAEGAPIHSATDWSLLSLVAYWHLCTLASFFFIIRWLYWRLTDRQPAFLRDQHSEFYNFEDDDPELLDGLPTQLIHALLPGSQLLVLSVDFKTFEFPQLPPAFNGYKISHLSDLHFTGRIGKAYFQQVFEQCVAWSPDMICITGDLLDKPKCLPWIEELLSQLKAPDGVYFILGNHDRRIKDEQKFRARLRASGLIDANGRFLSVDRSNETTQARLWLAGNELPWYRGAEQLPHCAQQKGGDSEDFFICLSHSPDQWPWAVQQGFDLMLAGHTHGGQVCLPVIGPIIAPSRFGVRYAGGIFQLGPMAMQVSRGVSGAEPLRWNCPPELAQITLQST